MMSDKIDWTKNLGDAVLAQQPDVMDAVQRLRAKAHAQQQARHHQAAEGQRSAAGKQGGDRDRAGRSPTRSTFPITIRRRSMVTWPYAEYPPYYFGYPSYIGAGVIAAGLAFGAGWAIGRWGNYWGGGFNWGNRNLYVNHYNRTPTSETTGSTIRRTARASDTTTPTLRSDSATTIWGRRSGPDGLSAAATASRSSTRERTAPARVIVPAIAQARSCRRRPVIAPRAGDRAKAR